MALAPATLTFDCAAPMSVAAFWAAAMGYRLDPDSDEEAAYISDPSGATQGLYFQTRARAEGREEPRTPRPAPLRDDG
jgi:Glyoxalase-like domain